MKVLRVLQEAEKLDGIFFFKLQFDLQVVVVEFHISFTLSLESFGIVHIFGFNIECCLTSTDIVWAVIRD